ncbi:MAG: TonB-dependent receptor [Myxococcaceae bacterium]|nr:TonB-dependent receptor [Myxococcaceae bacterium]
MGWLLVIALVASVEPGSWSPGSRFRAGGAVELPPVDVPVPEEEKPAQSPARRDPAAVVTTVEPSQHAGEVKDTAQLLAPSPGVTLSSSGGLGQTATLSVRGTASSGTLVLLDGVPLGGPGESVDLATIPAPIVQRLEVLRGSGSRYGPGALGGVLNVVTLRPNGGARLFAEGTQGSFETSLLSAGASGEVPGGQGLVVLHGARSEGNFDYRYRTLREVPGSLEVVRSRENNHALYGGGLMRYRADLPKGVLLDAVAEGLAYGRGLAGTVDNPTPDALEQGQRLTGAVRATKRFEGGGELEALGWARHNRNALVGGSFGPDVYRQNDTGAGVELNYSQLVFGWHGVSAMVSGGGEWLQGPSTVASPSWGRFAAMARDEVLLFGGDVTVDASVRVDRVGQFTGFSPKLGALWLLPKLPKGFELKGNVGQAWRAPSFFELYVQQGRMAPNAELRPERGLYVDGAAAFRHARGFVQVGGFYALYEDLISYEYYPPMLARPVNFAAAQVAGLEAEGRVQPLSWLTASASYGLLFTQNLKDDPRYYLQPLPYRPAHKVHARLAIGPKWLYARGEVLYQSEQFVNRTATLTLPGRVFVNVGATCVLTPSPSWPSLSLSFELKNLLDAQGADLDGYPLPPRAAYLTLGLSWDVVPERKS